MIMAWFAAGLVVGWVLAKAVHRWRNREIDYDPY
jgi:hypothetical protein